MPDSLDFEMGLNTIPFKSTGGFVTTEPASLARINILDEAQL